MSLRRPPLGDLLALVVASAMGACVTPPPRGAVPVPVPRRFRAPPPVRGQAALEQWMRKRVEHDRAAEGHGPLRWDERLVLLARAHDDDMIRNHYVAHVSPTQGGPANRLDHAGYLHRVVRENIAVAPTVVRAENGLLASPEHHENLMATDITRFGIGIVRGRGPSGLPTLYVTQIFATPFVPPTPEAVRRTLLDRIDRARAQRGLEALSPLPLLERLAHERLVSLSVPFAKGTLSSIAQTAVLRVESGKKHLVTGVSVAAQSIIETKDITLPPPALARSGRFYGVAAARRKGADGQPRVLVLLLVGDGE